MSEITHAELLAAARVMATELRRIEAQGGHTPTDHTAALLYERADSCHVWAELCRLTEVEGCDLHREVGPHEWRRAATLVEDWLIAREPSAIALEFARRILALGPDPEPPVSHGELAGHALGDLDSELGEGRR